MADNTEWVTVHDSAVTNTNPDSMVHVTLNTVPICSNMTNKQFADTVMRARDAGITLIQDRIAAIARWDRTEQDRARTYFGRVDEEIRSTLAAGLPRLLKAMRELVPEKIVRWDSDLNRSLSCAAVPDSGDNHAAVCKPIPLHTSLMPNFTHVPDASNEVDYSLHA